MEPEPKTKYRVFLSYSHDDQQQERILSEILENNGLYPISDSKLESGHGFHDQIKKFIAHAYVFMPVISKLSNQKGWVHEEIGYAMAQNIPILPILIEDDALPEDMIEELQAVKSNLKTEKVSQREEEKKRLSGILTWDKIDNMVRRSPYELKRPKYECAYYHIERTMMLVEYALDVRTVFKDQPKLFRQSGGLSSFHIPNSSPEGEEFRLRYLGSNQRVDFLNVWLRGERIVFEEFAKEWGFKIIINLDINFVESNEYAPIIRKSRLNTLLKFFKNILELPENPEIKFEVIIDSNLEEHRNILIVGDLFAAESLAGYHGQGLRQTMLTRHAPTVKNQIELFDVRFKELKNKQKDSSVKHAVAEIEKRLKKIRTELNKRK
jgi:hypothetical protein